jgi:phosphatidylserine/phosphatidylglycerophosphate/cardiolipin synthase-like enzyme
VGPPGVVLGADDVHPGGGDHDVVDVCRGWRDAAVVQEVQAGVSKAIQRRGEHFLPVGADVPGAGRGVLRVLGHREHQAAQEARRNPHLELVVSGPGSKSIKARRTEQVLLKWIGKATREILLVTYALYMYDDLRQALAAAIARGVEVTVLTEDPQDDPGFKWNPTKELAGLIVQRLRWPADERPENGAALHAKVAVIDGSTAFITSANLTKRAAGDNLEAGVLIRGGDIPERLIAHVRELRKQGRLTHA